MSNKLLDICERILMDKCVRYKDALFTHNSAIKIVEIDNSRLARVCVNFCYIPIPKTVCEKISKLPEADLLPRMEITMLNEEAETIGAWLALLALGQESPRPEDLLCWPCGDYAWTLRAAEIGRPERRFGC